MPGKVYSDSCGLYSETHYSQEICQLKIKTRKLPEIIQTSATHFLKSTTKYKRCKKATKCLLL